MDGFLDAADGIFSRRDRQKRLEIMKDPHCGPFAVLCCGGLLLLELGAWCQLASVPKLLPLAGCLVTVSRSCLLYTSVQCLSNDRRLMRHPFGSARPSGGYLFGRLLQQNGGDGAGGGGVADPHFAGNEQLCAACGRFFRQGYADFHSPAAVRRRHSGARRHIIGAAPDSSPLHTFMCVRCSDPHICLLYTSRCV